MEDYEKFMQLNDGKIIKIIYNSEETNLKLFRHKMTEINEFKNSLTKRMYSSGKIYIQDFYGNQVGSCWFHINNNSPKSCEIYGIEINDENYIGHGVGSIMMHDLEELAMSKNVQVIFGDFIPYGRFKDHSKEFYLRNGFQILMSRERRRMIFKKFIGKEASGLSNASNGFEDNYSYQRGN